MPSFPLRAFLIVLGLALPLAACVVGGISRQQDADLRAVYGRMRANDIAGLEAAFVPQKRSAALVQSLNFMQGMIPPDAPRARLLKGAVVRNAQGGVDYGATYEYDYAKVAVLAQIEMRQDKAGRKAVLALYMRQADRDIAGRYAFSLAGRKPYQYLFLVLMLMSPAFGAWGLVALWRAPDIKWKFLWALAMALGFMDLTMDWATGDVALNITFIHPLWVWARQFSPLSPWMLSTSLPVAAIAFLLGYRRLDRPWDPPKPPRAR